MEVHVKQKGAAVKPIVMSTCCCFERCDIQALLKVVSIFSRRYGIVSRCTGLHSAVGGRRSNSTFSLYVIFVSLFGESAVIENVLFFSFCRVVTGFVVFILGIRFQADRRYSTVGIRFIGRMVGRLPSLVDLRSAESQHVYRPSLVIHWHLGLDQHLWSTLKESSALLVQIHGPA